MVARQDVGNGDGPQQPGEGGGLSGAAERPGEPRSDERVLSGRRLEHRIRRSGSARNAGPAPKPHRPELRRCSELPQQLPVPEVRAGVSGKPAGACAGISI